MKIKVSEYFSKFYQSRYGRYWLAPTKYGHIDSWEKYKQKLLKFSNVFWVTRSRVNPWRVKFLKKLSKKRKKSPCDGTGSYRFTQAGTSYSLRFDKIDRRASIKIVWNLCLSCVSSIQLEDASNRFYLLFILMLISKNHNQVLNSYICMCFSSFYIYYDLNVSYLWFCESLKKVARWFRFSDQEMYTHVWVCVCVCNTKQIV